MNAQMAEWNERFGHPDNYDFQPSFELLKRYDHPEFNGELYRQANGPGTFQRVLMVFPKKLSAPVPAVAVPFYFPEALLAFEPETGEPLPYYVGIEMMLHLVRRGFAAASADAFHLTYAPSTRDRRDSKRWQEAADALLHDHPRWTGMGKLTADTHLLVDALAADPRVDADRIGIAGHSLGGKMAFYTGCLDSRIKAILTSDFGFGWEQTNWQDDWYWGTQIEKFKQDGLDHTSLLAAADPKPFMLIAGEADNDASFEYMKKAAYSKPGNLVFLNHASGHRPPPAILEKGYEFLEHWL